MVESFKQLPVEQQRAVIRDLWENTLDWKWLEAEDIENQRG